MARGQLSFIIIIAVIVVIMVGIVIYAARSSVVKRGEQQVETQQRTSVLIKPVNDYVTQCLDLAARTSLELFGNQGGFIYASQGGSVPDPKTLGTDHIVMEGTKVSYGILPPQGDVGAVFFSTPPVYPWDTFPQVFDGSTLLLASYLQGYYGINRLPQLDGPDSAQAQLESATLAKTISCLDWSIFEAQGLKVSSGTPNLQIVFGEKSTTFLLHNPIDVTSTVGGGTAHQEAFGVDMPVRFRKLLDVLHLVVDKDVTDISFDPSYFVHDGITIGTARDVYSRDDVLLFKDPLSTLGGQPYELRVARKNRAPALVWIPPASISSQEVCVGEELKIEPTGLNGEGTPCGEDFSDFHAGLNAYDPDEDIPTFVIHPHELIQPATTEYTIASGDGPYLPIVVQVSDGELTDEQAISVEVV